MHGDLVVAVFNRDSTKLVGGVTLPKITLTAGRSVEVATSYLVESDQTVVLAVDPGELIAESNHSNNRTTVWLFL